MKIKYIVNTNCNEDHLGRAQSARAVLATRQLDFEIVTLDFFETAVVVPAKGDRWIAIGRIDAVAYAVIFKPLGSEALSIISLRRASRKERRALL